ncbi:MAG TPA: aminotransferase class I/II-fold pyridoxal phosphate-dependent enzyme, partial [Myxococcota bacterium]|nr:aminotransferase class I/II-fold pyridoxal phosphate-dependent enzyme [Myxococcota bacterium]
AILLNSPHNPTGKVFTHQELELIAQLCRKYNVICISDEVYEHLVYTGVHTPMATLLPELTITLSSLGKSFSLTGWKIGWACAPAPLAAAVRSAHQFITFATATPFQAAAAIAVAAPDDFFIQLQREYRERRDYLTGVLQEVGFEVWEPEGTYFTCASLRGTGYTDDFAFAKHLIAHGVATIPPSAFYEQPELGRGYVRFAFCKRRETLEAAAERLRAWRKL